MLASTTRTPRIKCLGSVRTAVRWSSSSPPPPPESDVQGALTRRLEALRDDSTDGGVEFDGGYKSKRRPEGNTQEDSNKAPVPPRVVTSSPGSGARLVDARNNSAAYTRLKHLPDDERARFRKDLQERFRADARSLPMTIKGLESLANERIEDAMRRGKFANLPRGKLATDEDTRTSSPFIDSTEYILNRMIQRQDIVPAWIEKQQEIIAASAQLRARLRIEWRRHVAKTIASRGGSLESQVRAAEDYARAERERGMAEEGTGGEVFRDPDWLRTEYAYHQLAVEELNSLTRSYNLICPPPAQRPYFALQRELDSCYADAAPLVAQEIEDRAKMTTTRGEAVGTVKKTTGAFQRLVGEEARVYDDERPQFGLRDLFRLWFGSRKKI